MYIEKHVSHSRTGLMYKSYYIEHIVPAYTLAAIMYVGI